MLSELSVDVAVIGAGTAGLYALREVRRARRSFVLIDHGPLGTTCARVGCMPSKMALHAGGLWAARREMAAVGISGAERLDIDPAQAWAGLRRLRDQLAGGAAGKATSAAGEHLLSGSARFLEPTLLEITFPDGRRQRVRAGAVVIATGSRPVRPAFLDPVAARTVTTDELFELPTLPESVGILGLGAIGLEMGLALSRMGLRVVGADVAPTVAGIADPEVRTRALARFGDEMALWLGQAATVASAADGVLLRSGGREAKVDLLLAALGRRANVDDLNLAAAGFPLDERGLPRFDPATLRIGDLPVFIAGDANASRPLMHEAADEGAIAGYNAARGLNRRFRQKVALGIAFSDPDVISVGLRFDELPGEGVLIGQAGGEHNARSRVIGAESNLLRVYADAADGRLLGAAMLGVKGEHLAHLLAWAIQRGETAHSLLEMPFYHPVVEETLQSALQDIARHLKRADGLPAGLRVE